MQITAPDGTVVTPTKVRKVRTYARGSVTVHGATPESVRVIAAERTAFLDIDGAASIWPHGEVGDVVGYLFTLADIGRAITAQAEARMAEVVA